MKPNDTNIPVIETHPLEPFLPEGARILMSGSFPPPRARWCMDFYYPNRQNDMWRIWAYIATGNKDAFMLPDGKTFDKEKIIDFCQRIGLALTDTGEQIVRERGNASDAHLKVVKPRDFGALLDRIPLCHDIALTGEKAVDTLGATLGFDKIEVGGYIETEHYGRHLRIWRMPSSSRAFPRSIEWKADYYRRLLDVATASAPM
ncbi:MAG: uracil-DNA glycosylase family protein [Muribaculaceae bacterium]|nr:uracil-DNA glycosylase family protein [Muribaculaceae bacterium]